MLWLGADVGGSFTDLVLFDPEDEPTADPIRFYELDGHVVAEPEGAT